MENWETTERSGETSATCVILDHNTVIFEKEKGGVHIKITGMQDSNHGRQK
jgi:hypothetical protein